MGKYVYFFGGGKAEGKADMKLLLGGKGANLAEMTNAGLPVPEGFTITTNACADYYTAGKKWPKGLDKEVEKNIKQMEKVSGKTFGGKKNPLLVSVRSGAAVSMPGMMDTVLNLGLNPDSLQALIDATGNERFAWDAYRRFIQMFGDVVMDCEHHDFEHELEAVKKEAGVEADTDLTVDDLKKVVDRYLKVVKKDTGQEFPTDPRDQLAKAINAVFGSWNNPRAIKYRQLNDIKGLNGTAVNVQAMVYGNMGDDSGTGVAFTRDPSNGTNEFYGEYLMNAQGEDVVAGIRTPKPISTLKAQNPKIYDQLYKIRSRLEKHYTDMQDLEFTIEKGKLFMLQTRNGKRTIFAAIKMAVDMAREKLITPEKAIMRVDAKQLGQLFAPIFDSKDLADAESSGRKMTQGLNASPGAATGIITFNADEAERLVKKEGKKVILVRIETSPEDIGGMAVAEGILTARGGMTSHAAVVARGMGTPCVAGAGDCIIDYKAGTMRIKGKTFKSGDWLSIDGFTGNIYGDHIEPKPSEILQVLDGKMKPEKSELFQDFQQIMKWTDKYRRLGVRTNADTPADAKRAVSFGAEGIGLTRTEHMFFEGDRILSFRRLILVAEEVKNLRDALETASGDAAAQIRKQLESPEKQYKQALDELLPLQREDFVGIFKALEGRPATIRLLDPPLHEFLPHDEAGQREMASKMGVSLEKVKETVDSLHEFNPMLGHRGCRLGITYPEVTATQVRAIMEAAVEVKKSGIKVQPEIMIPLVGTKQELALQKELAEKVIAEVLAETKTKKNEIPVKIGTMIEVPRAAVTADEVAEVAEFFSFGTNDLTQMGCGFSRDDAGKFLGEYVKLGIYEYDPFQVLDQTGIGKLVEMACEKGRATRPDIKLGICGEHGGEPMSVEFCHRTGLNYVSCSPFRVPVARLAAAQAVIRETTKGKSAKKAGKKVGKKTGRKGLNMADAKSSKKAAKKTTSKKTAKKTTKKAAAKAPAKKTAAKKVAKKTTAKKATKKVAKKTVAKKTAAKKVAKKTTAKKAAKKVAKKTTAKKAAKKTTKK